MKGILRVLFFVAVMALFYLVNACKSSEQISAKKCAKAKAKYEVAAFKFGCPLETGVDTLRITNTIIISHDTTFYIPIPGEVRHDTLTVTITNGVVNSAMSRLDVTYAYATAQVRGGILYLNIYQRETVIAKTIKDAIQSNSRVDYQTITKTVSETTNHIKPFQWFQIWCGRIFLLIIIGLSFYVILKNLLKPRIL